MNSNSVFCSNYGVYLINWVWIYLLHGGQFNMMQPGYGIRVLSIIFFLSVNSISAQTVKNDLDYGLAFVSHEASKDQRTSLNLNPDSPFLFDRDFQIRFDFSLRRLQNAFGYVARIIVNDSLNIDLVCSPEHSDFYDLSIVINNSPTEIHYDFAEVDLKARQWTPVVIRFALLTNQIAFSWCGKEKVQAFPMAKMKNLRFYFGANPHGKFNTSDVPPMNLKNIRISKMTKPELDWELKKHRVNEVYDNLQGRVAIVKNGIWLIDQHTKWTLRKTMVIGKYPSIAFNSGAGIMYCIDKNHVYEYDIPTGVGTTGTPVTASPRSGTTINFIIRKIVPCTPSVVMGCFHTRAIFQGTMRGAGSG